MNILTGSHVLHNIPPAPPLPKYSPEDEAPKWNWERIHWGVPYDTPLVPFEKIGKTPDPDKPDWRGVIKNNVIELEMPKPYKHGQYHHKNYFWFDTPDYADPFKKMWYATKWFGLTGVFFGSTYFGILLQEKFTLSSFSRMMRTVTLPWFFAGLAGSATVITVANLRGKKDDYFNWAAAGIIFSCVLPKLNHITWTRNAVLSTAASIALKYDMESNGSLHININPRAFDTSLSGLSANHGISSGDLRLGIRGSRGDPGRDLRTTY